MIVLVEVKEPTCQLDSDSRNEVRKTDIGSFPGHLCTCEMSILHHTVGWVRPGTRSADTGSADSTHTQNNGHSHTHTHTHTHRHRHTHVHNVQERRNFPFRSRSNTYSSSCWWRWYGGIRMSEDHRSVVVRRVDGSRMNFIFRTLEHNEATK